ncbi:MAG: DNA topoisomerase III [Firmicutes bacterium]|nr:DNA topoisomerase III [Bacillota bacterium]
MKSLVLAEKPSVARELARVLGCTQKQKSHFEGPRYVVTWALGHLVELAEPEDYDKKYATWRMEDLPITPKRMKLKVIRQTSHQFKAINSLCKRKDLGELIIATDAGREGELVARWIMELVHWQKPFKRLWISSQTDRAIKDGFANLRPGKNYDNLFRSAVCRAEADWLIGLNITRALTSKYNAQLAAGRVQTPTLAMLVQREQEIRAFRPKNYWTLEADLGRFRGQWRGKQDGRLFAKDTAEELLAKVVGKDALVSEVKIRERVEPSPLAYDLTELQRDANKRYGFSAKQTSNVLQRLYEQHKLVTYPRTDSRHLSSDMVSTLPARMKAVAVGPYASLARPLTTRPLQPGKRVVDDSKVSDHHAIIPTDETLQLGVLTNDERRLYDLIVRRFIALFYPPCRYDETQVTLTIGGEQFQASGRIMKDAGWKAVYEKEENEEGSQSLPPLNKGDKLPVRRCQLKPGQTTPPTRHTEASLLSLMEKHNLGTPATRADIIEKLLNSETIERKGSALNPTAKGMQLLDLVVSDLRSPELTARWERELENIARGTGNMEKFLTEIRQRTREIVREVAASEKKYVPHNVSRARCPHCGEHLRERKGRQGKMLVCPNRECNYRLKDEKNLTNKRCPQCHKKMELRKGKAGKFFHCRPCNVIEQLDGEKRVDTRKQKQLVNKYKEEKPLTGSMADALKAALEKKDD